MDKVFLMQFLTIAFVHFLAVISPGPDFAMVINQSIRYGKRTAMITSIGIGTGILFHVGYCLLGIGLIISKSIMAFNIMKIAASIYLIVLGLKALKTKPIVKEEAVDLQHEGVPSFKKAFVTGLLTNGLNPKATLFMLSLFTVVIRPDTPMSYQVGYGVYMFIATCLWFIFMSYIFGNDYMRKRFRSIGHWVDKTMGGILIILGLKLAFTRY